MDFATLPVGRAEAEIGRRIEAYRLAANISQAQLAAEAGVSRRTVSRLENGEGVSLDTLIRVLRALGLAGRLEALLPEPEVRPIERIRLKGKQRRRARPRPEAGAADWHWADEPDETGETP